MNDTDRLACLERAVAALASERLQQAPRCHCGKPATYFDPATLGHRDMCDTHGSPVSTAKERVDASAVRAFSEVLDNYRAAVRG